MPSCSSDSACHAVHTRTDSPLVQCAAPAEMTIACQVEAGWSRWSGIICCSRDTAESCLQRERMRISEHCYRASFAAMRSLATRQSTEKQRRPTSAHISEFRLPTVRAAQRTGSAARAGAQPNAQHMRHTLALRPLIALAPSSGALPICDSR